MECLNACRTNTKFVAALAKRGISKDDLEFVQVDPFSAGNFGHASEQGKRIVNAFVWMRSSLYDNGYAKPIEGLNVHYDLNAREVIDVLDEEVLHVPTESANYSRHPSLAQPKMRCDLQPISITQDNGPSFRVNGNQVEWVNWRLHVEFNAREGLVLNDIRWATDGDVRPLFHRISIAEMVVPYGDPSHHHPRKNAFDVGEYGMGRLANSLALGCDCRGHIYYFDGVLSTVDGLPEAMENVICMHEEDAGMLWKHTDYFPKIRDIPQSLDDPYAVEVRRGRRLVISSIATVGNYEYGFFWNLYLDGTLELEVKATGIMNTAGKNAQTGDRYGTEVLPDVVAHNHQHIFCARIDAAVDGDRNSVTEVNMVQEPMDPQKNKWGNAFRSEETLLKTEHEAMRDRSSSPPSPYDGEKSWKICSCERKNRFGNPTAYKLIAHSMVRPFFHDSTLLARRAAFAKHNIWVTPYDDAERYPAGYYVNQSDGSDTIEEWMKKDRDHSVTDRDIVLWHCFGLTHTPRLEDFPVQPVVRCGFKLVPDGFFDWNPTLDIPPAQSRL